MLLLIPGPVTTRPEVREAFGHDFAPWDNDFRPLLAEIRERVLHIAHGVPGQHATLRCRAADTSSPRRRSAPSSRSATSC